MSEKKRIGILTSGGDAPGMNAGVRAATLRAIGLGYEVVGVIGGYKGLIDNYVYTYKNGEEPDGNHYITPLDLKQYGKTSGLRILTERDVDDIIDKSGTILYSDRCDRFNSAEGMAMAAESCRRNGIMGLVTIGGDGTLSGATEFTIDQKINCVGFPGSIDNDLVTTDYTVGFDTAMNTVVEMADNTRYTCNSHCRGEVIEVMGRGAGDIALNAGIASGANAIWLKEDVFGSVEEKVSEICEKLDALRLEGKHDFTVIVAEGVPLDIADEGHGKLSEYLAQEINYRTGDADDEETEAKRAADPTNKKIFRPNYIETKFVRLAHVVRGGIPTLRDRLTASRMAVMAVEELHAGRGNEVIVEQNGQLKPIKITYSLSADKIYKLKLNKPYKDKGMLNAGMEKDYAKLQKKYDKFSAGLSAEEKAEIEAFTDAKLAEFRALCNDAKKIDG